MNGEEKNISPQVEGAHKGPSIDDEVNFEEERKMSLSKLEDELISPSVENPPESEIVRRLRTLKGDVEDTLKGGKTTIVSVASAASRERASENSPALVAPENPITKYWLAGLIIVCIFILSGVGIFVWGFFFAPNENQIVGTPADSFLYAEEVASLDTTNLEERRLREEFIALRESVDGKLGSIINIVPIEKTDTGERIISTEEFLNLLDSSAPDSLKRSLIPHFFAGIHVFDGNQWFFIFKTTSYEQTFASMLQYERSLQRSFGPIIRREKDFAFATTTTLQLSLLNFRDSVLKNKDVRMITNEVGKPLLLYTFLDRETLIIAGNEETLGAVITRLSSPRRVD